MDNTTDFKSSSITISQVNQGAEQGKGIWQLKDWDSNLQTLRANSFCTVKVGTGTDKKHGVRIFFGNANFTPTTKVLDPQSPGSFKRSTYIPLWVELKMVGSNYPVIDSPVIVSLDVYQLSQSLDSEKIFASNTVTFNLHDEPQKAAISTFLEYSCFSYSRLSEIESAIPQPENLRFGIKVTISPINKTLAMECSEKVPSEAALSEHFGKMYQSDVNFSDLKLETKDNMTLSTHKFIVAARCPMLNEMIRKETVQEGFAGTIKVDVDAKPMLAILHWMYTGEVYDKAGLVMEQLIEAAMKFNLPGLIKILDKKMISICTEDNMFALYQAAKKCGMITAVDDIGAFIAGKLSKPKV